MASTPNPPAFVDNLAPATVRAERSATKEQLHRVLGNAGTYCSTEAFRESLNGINCTRSVLSNHLFLLESSTKHTEKHWCGYTNRERPLTGQDTSTSLASQQPNAKDEHVYTHSASKHTPTDIRVVGRPT
eukprot:gb/GECG01016643.1/.p1 GENE.gb/GECG01016643.1/~~gb/GECG01016643.1/.p1  ORF type:complete len:130 (+),score=8.90 gb/GECG01016643.1/:1-390(+)